MKQYRNTLVIGLVLLAGSLSAAWSAGRAGSPLTGLLGGDASVEPTLSDEFSAAATAAGAPSWDLPVTHNQHVERWISFLSKGNHKHTEVWLARQGKYGPMIRAELRRRGMPEDLLYLALIESGLSPRAYSRAAASGMWQFIAETGRRYGLEVTGEVDERRDPIKSTSAALDYLQELYNRFGSWYLAAAAYNSGEYRVERILKQHAGGARGDDELFWKIAPHLPRETRDYVPLMLAAGHIAKEPAKYGFDDLEYEDPLRFDVVWVPGSTELATIARAAGVAEDEIADLNPHLPKKRTPASRGWSVRIPEGTRISFDRSFPTLYRTIRLAEGAQPPKREREVATARPSTARTHKVRRGETLSTIAARYGVSVNSLRAANSNVEPRRLTVGRTLKVPTSGKSVASAKPTSSSTKTVASAKTKSSSTRFHRVSRGENLSLIAARYGVTVRQLRSWNGLSGSRINAGQRLRITA